MGEMASGTGWFIEDRSLWRGGGINQTPGNHPKVDILNTEHGESLKPRRM
jgi:hypothetical protein